MTEQEAQRKREYVAAVLFFLKHGPAPTTLDGQTIRTAERYRQELAEYDSRKGE